MKRWLTSVMASVLTVCGYHAAQADLLSNGSLDVTYQQEITPGFFLPKPATWINNGSRTISGPYEDEMSSEPWAGPAPTPVTTGGVGGDDWAVFFKAFSGGGANGPATGHLFQDVLGSPGVTYMLTGWAGAEANYLADRTLFAIDFLDGANSLIASTELDLPDLFVDNGQAFDYKQYTVIATAPANTASVRARVSMIDGTANPLGGGQAFVVDDFELTAIPEPASVLIGLLGLLGFVGLRLLKGRSN
jgi:hypothetical protein